MDLSGSRQDSVVGSCERGHESLGYVIDGEFLEYLTLSMTIRPTSEVGLWFLELPFRLTSKVM
jgi:hypothetical protein